MAGFPPRDRDAFITHWKTKILDDGTVIAKTVMADEHVAGNVVSFEHDGRREVGYWIGKEFWGRGIATRALTIFLGLDSTRPLYAGVARHNVASIRVLDRCGFRSARESAREADDDHMILMTLEA